MIGEIVEALLVIEPFVELLGDVRSEGDVFSGGDVESSLLDLVDNVI